MLAFGIAAILLGTAEVAADLVRHRGLAALGLSQLVVGLAAVTAYVRLCRGRRPDPFPTLRAWLTTRRLRRSGS